MVVVFVVEYFFVPLSVLSSSYGVCERIKKTHETPYSTDALNIFTWKNVQGWRALAKA